MVPTVDPLDAPEVELDFMVWASLRDALAGEAICPDHQTDDWEPMVHPFGLRISEGCPSPARPHRKG